MRRLGRLFVFEGPDGVGKSELSARYTRMLNERGIRAKLLSFPGMDEGTVGKLVYELHHRPGALGVEKLSPSSMQLMHIAAHIDAIETVILSTLREGISVVLDRFWWSTKVYGLAGGSNSRLLDSMIAVELAAWGRVRPTIVFLIERRIPLRPEPEAEWQRWRELYERVATEEHRNSKIIRIDNNGAIEVALAELAANFGEGASDRRTDVEPQIPLDLSSTDPTQVVFAPSVFSGLSPAVPTVVYDTYWRFAAERQRIFFKRWQRQSPPWTSDHILAEFKFTNVYRASDRVSQFLIKDVIYAGDQSEEEVFFRAILFKLFNKVETWQLLKKAFGEISYSEFDLKAYDHALTKASISDSIYSGAYIMPSGSRAFGTTRKHRSHLQLLEQMMEDEVALRVADAKKMVDVFKLLRSYPMLGDFLAYQYATDLNYSNLTDFSEMEFVVPGPGAKGGISKCFNTLGGLTEEDLIRVVTDRQHAEFERLGIEFKSLWGRDLQLVDCQNLFCEVDKYSRVYHPEVAGKSGRTRIKQRFRPIEAPIDYWFPPKWGLNERIVAAKKELGDEASRVSA